MKNKIKIAVVDDHNLFRVGLVQLIQSLGPEFDIIQQAINGQDFLDNIMPSELPDIVLLDISMPIMDGFETAKELQKSYPSIRVLVISMNEDEFSLIRMLKFGVKGFIGKDIEPQELKMALIKINSNGFYYTDRMTEHLINSLQHPDDTDGIEKLTDNEIRFLKLACSEDTYSQIAYNMSLSPRTIDGYRESVFNKLKVRTRVGLVMFSIKANLVKL